MFGFISLIADALEILARGGGGGSGGGGGGGGGAGASGGSGGGGGFMLLYFAGYLPVHFLTARVRKMTRETRGWIPAQVISWFALALLLLPLVLFLQGPGLFVWFGALGGIGGGLYDMFRSLKLRKAKQVDEKLTAAAQLDPAWDQQTLVAKARIIFRQYQQDWSDRNWQNVASYATPRYAQHASLMIAALMQAKRIDRMENVAIDETVITDIHDSQDNAEDSATVGFVAHADDTLIDETNGETLFVDASSFTEYWTFRRVGDDWKLDRIDQATANESAGSATLRALAEVHGYFYSLDWGWLLIPKRGDLFGSAKFGTSDINNHIIGVYNNSYLLQLYTYNPNATGSNTNYLIAQTNVPKEYGRIVVRRKKWTNLVGPTGLRKISMEWGDFNKKYEVYASSAEGATSFELLHPVYMEKLEALGFEVNIEVVDNVVYLYSPHKLGKEFADDYEVMLNLLQEAYKQMRL